MEKMTSKEYEKIIKAGNGAKALLYSEELSFFREYIKMQQEEILKRVACDMLNEVTSEKIIYDEAGKIVGKRAEKTTKEARKEAAKKSYQTLIDINDFLINCQVQAEALTHMYETKQLILDNPPEEEEEIEYDE